MNKKSVFFLAMLVLFSGCATVRKTPEHYMQKDQVLKNIRVAILVTDGFEQVEMVEPREALKEAGAETTLISPKAHVQGYNHDEKGDSFPVDLALDEASTDDFDAVLLPGGVKNPDKLRLIPKAVLFVEKMGKAEKPIAAICHGPWLLINAKLVSGLTMTSWPSLRIDLENAGAKWIDQSVVVDKNIITSRKPEDIWNFNAAMIELFAKKAKPHR